MGRTQKKRDVSPNWNEVYGSVDFTQYTSKQNIELSDGQFLGLPIQLYADPSIPEEKMRDMRDMLSIICPEFQKQEQHAFREDMATHWDNILGPVDLTPFTDEQLSQIHEGRYNDLPVQFYADPFFSPQKMLELRTMLETSRAVLTAMEGVRYVCTDYGPEQLHHWFRSESNFAKYPQRVCYVPENWNFEDGPGITGQEIVDLCDGDHLKAEMVFNLCDWQFPSTILDEWDREDNAALEVLRTGRAEFSRPDALANQLQSAYNRQTNQPATNLSAAERDRTR